MYAHTYMHIHVCSAICMHTHVSSDLCLHTHVSSDLCLHMHLPLRIKCYTYPIFSLPLFLLFLPSLPLPPPPSPPSHRGRPTPKKHCSFSLLRPPPFARHFPLLYYYSPRYLLMFHARKMLYTCVSVCVCVCLSHYPSVSVCVRSRRRRH